METNKTIFDGMKEETTPNQYSKFQNDQVLVLANVKSEVTEEFEFEGKKVKKKIYELVSGEKYKVPIILHNLIVRCRNEYGSKISSVKIKIEGSGLNTRYNVLPVIQ